MISRLSNVAPDLAARLQGQTRERLRIAAATAAGLAAERARVTDQRLGAALTALRNDRFGDTAERSGVQRLTSELDEIAWDAQEKAEAGTVSRDAYLAAFRRARAAASVGFALDCDALNAALEAIYEAQAAVGDVNAVRAAVNAALR